MKQLLFVLILGLAAYLLYASLPIFYVPNEKTEYLTIIGNKGAQKIAPENTMASFKTAESLGAGGIMLQVQQTSDEKIIVLDYPQLNRTTSASGFVKSQTWENLQTHSAGIMFSDDYRYEPIPTLEEVLSSIPTDIKIIIELNENDEYYPNFYENIASIIETSGSKERVEVVSFKNSILKGFHEAAPTIHTGKIMYLKFPFTNIIYDTTPHTEELTFIDSVYIYYNFARKDLIEEYKNNDKNVYIWGANELQLLYKFSYSGIDGIVTDHPEEYLRGNV
ncbi:hypothetical protein KC717_02685 [Candidatus Dojkabacteria bacterium]|uniref:GP-PDE domain-containing protein n=1 Tax=Candidatus Dojkabacteria bacterium TaxID=2099670 RepID=A0A955L8F4_9BACT|nr:hypothetical protein [Candidatus Dojkabacteria bacterium]